MPDDDRSQARADSTLPVSGAAPRANHDLARFLFENFHAELTSFLRRALDGNAALAEDMAQDAITRIAAADRRYSPERARSLLYSIARNILIDHFRSERSRTASMMSLRVIEHDVDAISPLETLLWREDLTRVRAAILALPPRCRQVFVLSRFEGMNYTSIARHCEISVSMVEKHLYKALRLIAKAIEEPMQDKANDGNPTCR